MLKLKHFIVQIYKIWVCQHKTIFGIREFLRLGIRHYPIMPWKGISSPQQRFVGLSPVRPQTVLSQRCDWTCAKWDLLLFCWNKQRFPWGKKRVVWLCCFVLCCFKIFLCHSTLMVPSLITWASVKLCMPSTQSWMLSYILSLAGPYFRLGSIF